jgi:acyl-CoA hydrolase
VTLPILAYADGLDSARSSPAVVAAAAGLGSDDVEVLLGWTPAACDWLLSPALRGRTVMAGYALGRAVAEGRLRYLPVRLSAMPRAVAGGLRPDVAVVTGVRRGSELVFGASVGWGPAVARAADQVVVEVDDDGADLGGPPIPGRIVATIERPTVLEAAPSPRPPVAVDHRIAAHVLSVLPDEPTLQFGPGGVAEAILAALDRPIRIWSGLVTDALAGLDARGLLLGAATAAYVWGGNPAAELAAAGRLELRAVDETHDLSRVAGIERFVGCNTALQVGLDGSVNVERVAGRLVAGIGGHADFCAAASKSDGGVSIIALPSTTRTGASTIVPVVETTSTPRCDVEVVVTEHGVADLRGVDDRERAKRIAAVAAPEHRAWLQTEANEAG